MSVTRAVVFESEGTPLVGIVDIPAQPRQTGLLVVTGGPQYRVGSHRLFTLLCRNAATHQFASMHFDFRGSGDSIGKRLSFESLAPDIDAAITKLLDVVPQLRQIVILGLCDGASAALMYAHRDSRVAGVIMLNPWVHTEGSMEHARVRWYYPARLISSGFWKRLLRGKVNILKSLRSLQQHLGATYTAEAGFLQSMLFGARQFDGRVLVLLSGQDMTAQEYRVLLNSSDDWRLQMTQDSVQQHVLKEANHTFASAEWREAVFGHCVSFLKEQDDD
ncbi:MAG: hydrolase 1, exosortase A system-associated [Gammaproteobacteria bacterium]|nr:hydrolase 1, exosortase A system-associated [Gammaproteobacteria bacterium]MDH3767768.1 hydrolase 1, exosortase A system-associated [Gammaproteobacteria bacterium]